MRRAELVLTTKPFARRRRAWQLRWRRCARAPEERPRHERAAGVAGRRRRGGTRGAEREDERDGRGEGDEHRDDTRSERQGGAPAPHGEVDDENLDRRIG